MKIIYDGIEEQNNIITLSDIPNILTIEDVNNGTVATVTITVVSAVTTTVDGQYYIQFMGDTISSVISPDNAINKNFIITNSLASTAASIARSLRNCPTVSAAFIVEHNNDTVIIKSREIGSVFSGMQDYFSNNMNGIITSSVVDGTSQSDLTGAKVDVDIYKAIGGSNEYVTTLEKNFYGDEVSFNISPVLTTISEYGYAMPYQLRISSYKDGNYSQLGTIGTNYASMGYMVNQGMKYIPNDYMNVAMNYGRGTYRGVDNNTILYIYKPVIELSVYTSNASGFSYTIDYLNSAFETITSYTGTMTANTNSLEDFTFELNHGGGGRFQQAFYVDLTVGTTKLRYNVIKPLKATEECHRIYWRNSYGGISFVDMTGQKTETRDLSVMTYERNIFDYYNSEYNELSCIYDNDVDYTVTLKSHLFENDGKYIFNDLLQSAKVWTEVNGEKYAIIIQSIAVDETEQNDIYEATIKFKFSQKPSLL